jgi:glutathione S-transferase
MAACTLAVVSAQPPRPDERGARRRGLTEGETMLKIHHVPGTRSIRVIWLCEELAVPYEIVRVDFSAEYRQSPEWRALNPVGKVPVLAVDGFTMFESGAMVQHILDWHAPTPLEPERATREHALYLQWSWFAEATFARPIGEIVNHRRSFPGREVAEVIEEMRGRARVCADAVDGAVADRPYLLGDGFTAADIMMGYTIMIYRRLVSEELPANLESYWSRLTARPAFQATMAANQK